jgi:hypothetical protein
MENTLRADAHFEKITGGNGTGRNGIIDKEAFSAV